MKKLIYVIILMMFLAYMKSMLNPSNALSSTWWGAHAIGTTITIYDDTHLVSTSAEADPNSCRFKVYKNLEDAYLTSGDNTLIDSANTTGFVGTSLTLSNDIYSPGNTYDCRFHCNTGGGSGTTGNSSHVFQVIAASQDCNVVSWNGEGVLTPDTAGAPKVTIKDGTGTGEIDLTSGQVTVGTNNDKTGYTASTVGDKTGYSLAADQGSVTIGVCTDVTNPTTFDNTWIGSCGALGAQAKQDVNAECDSSLNDYDPPTKAEMDAGHSPLATSAALITHDDKIASRVPEARMTQLDDSGLPSTTDAINTKIGTPIALAGGTATVSGMVNQLADNEHGDFAAGESLHDIAGAGGGGITAQQVRNAMGLAYTGGTPAIDSIDGMITSGRDELALHDTHLTSVEDHIIASSGGGSCDLTVTNNLINTARNEIAVAQADLDDPDQFKATGFSTYDPLTDKVIVSSGSKSGYDLNANQSGVTVGTVTTVTNGVTVTTNNDKTGYTASTVTDKTGYSMASDQSGVTIGTVNNITNGVGLEDGAITSPKYDRSSAFPVAFRDSGFNKIARTGSGGDDLGSLSDQHDLTYNRLYSSLVNENNMAGSMAIIDQNIDSMLAGVSLRSILGDDTLASTWKASLETMVPCVVDTGITTGSFTADCGHKITADYRPLSRVIYWLLGSSLYGEGGGIDNFIYSPSGYDTIGITGQTAVPQAGDKLIIH